MKHVKHNYSTLKAHVFVQRVKTFLHHMQKFLGVFNSITYSISSEYKTFTCQKTLS